MNDLPSVKRIFTLALRVGEILLANGATTAQIEETMRRVASLYGFPPRYCHPNVVFTFVSLSFDHPDMEYPLTSLRQVKRRGVNYSQIMAVFALLDEKYSPEKALLELEDLAQNPQQHPHALSIFSILLCWACASAASNLLLGGSLREMFACFLIVLPAQFCRLQIARSNIPAPIGDLLAAALVTILSLTVITSHMVTQTDLVIASSLFGILPGSAIVLSAQDLISGDLISSAARGLEAIFTGAVVAAGVGMALSIGNDLHASTGAIHVQLQTWGWLWQLLAAFIASMCFARATAIPRFATVSAGLIGASGWLITLILAPTPTTVALPFTVIFLAALAVGLLSRLGSHIQHAPMSIYIIPAIFPLLPGLTLYRGMLAIAHGQTTPGLVLLVQAISVGGIVAMGVAISGIYEPLHRFIKLTLRRWQRRASTTSQHRAIRIDKVEQTQNVQLGSMRETNPRLPSL